jgi:pilus assembly protein CpaF
MNVQIALEVTGGVRLYSCSLDQPLWIGRDASCDIVLDSQHVSRKHACLDLENGALRLRDASVNGTEVDGRVIVNETEALALPAQLVVGMHRLLVRLPRSIATGSHAFAPPAARPMLQAPVPVELRRRIQRELLDHLDLARVSPSRIDVAAMRPKIVAALDGICASLPDELPDHAVRARLVAELTDEALELGPLTALLHDPTVSEIMVVDPETIYVERGGLIEETGQRFTDDDAVRAVIERIVTPIGRRIDESCPLVDARLPDGSRVNAIIPPLATRGACITIRKRFASRLSLSELVLRGSLSTEMARFLEQSVLARRNIVIAGGTGSGKTTLLNVLSGAIPSHERIVTIEDAVELQLQQKHVVSLEAKLANLEGRGAFTIRDLLKNALRMRPDRIVVGECRGGEALDMLQAMNTGHEGSMTTTHANSPGEAISRLETLCLMAGLDLPLRVVRYQLATSVHLLVQQARLPDGTRRVTSIAEVVGIDPDGLVDVREIFRFEQTGMDQRGQVLGVFVPTGYLPSFMDVLMRQGAQLGALS